MIEYALHLNHLTTDPDDHMAVVQDQTPKTKEDIIQEMVSNRSRNRLKTGISPTTFTVS